VHGNTFVVPKPKYRVFDLKTPIKNAHCWAQGVPREMERDFPCSLISPIFCVKILAF
jgi:hypothetical protein